MKKTVMLIISLSIISSSSLFGGKDKAINPHEAKDMPIASHEGKGAPIMGQQKSKLEKIKKLALIIEENPKSARNKRHAKKIMRLVDGLL